MILVPSATIFNNVNCACISVGNPGCGAVRIFTAFERLKTECVYGREFNTREEIVNAVRDYLDYDNHRRIQLKLKGLSPIQYRRQSLCG